MIVEAEGKKIHVFGREKNGKRYHKIIEDFKPYFYIKSNEKTEMQSINGEFVKKVFVYHPGFVRQEREKYRKTWEADITYTNRFLIDRFDKIEKEPLRILWFDIECKIDDKGFPSAEEARNQITLIGCYDSFLRKYVQFFYHTDLKKNTVDKNRSIYYFSSEIEMLKKFIEFIKDTDPDILLGWNSWNFDFPYIFNRMKRIGLDPNELSPLKETKKEFNWVCKGRILHDYMKLYQHIQDTSKSSYALDSILRDELGRGKLDLQEDLTTTYEKNPEQYLRYNLRDIEGLLQLEQKLQLIPYYDELVRLTKSDWDDITANSRVLDFFLINFCNKKGLVLPTKNKNDGIEKMVKGAYRENFTNGGIFKNVINLDIISMYPSIIANFNIGTDTLDREGKIEVPTGARFNSKKRGVVAQAIEELLEERMKWKKKMKSVDKDSKKYTIYHLRQYALKIILNSFYGQYGFKGSRIYSPECLGAVTSIGRELIKHCKKITEDNMHKLLYLDTDGLYVLSSKNIPEKIVEEGKQLQEKINDSLEEFSNKFGTKNRFLKIDFDEVYSKIFFSKVKLRMAARYMWKGGKFLKGNDYVIKGFETRRSNNSRVSRKTQRLVFEIILGSEGNEKKKVFNFVKNTIKMMKNGKFHVDDIAIPQGITRNPYTYTSITPPIRGAIHSNKFHNERIVAGDKIKYIYVRNCPPKTSRTDVISYKTRMPEGYTVDIDMMIEKTIYMKLRPIFDCMGWNITELKGQNKLEEWL